MHGRGNNHTCIIVQYNYRWTVTPDELRRSYLKLVADRASLGRLAKAWRRPDVLVHQQQRTVSRVTASIPPGSNNQEQRTSGRGSHQDPNKRGNWRPGAVRSSPYGADLCARFRAQGPSGDCSTTKLTWIASALDPLIQAYRE